MPVSPWLAPLRSALIATVSCATQHVSCRNLHTKKHPKLPRLPRLRSSTWNEEALVASQARWKFHVEQAECGLGAVPRETRQVEGPWTLDFGPWTMPPTIPRDQGGCRWSGYFAWQIKREA